MRCRRRSRPSSRSRFLVRYFKTRTLIPFAIYCLVFGFAMVIYTPDLAHARSPARHPRRRGCTIIDGRCPFRGPRRRCSRRAARPGRRSGLLRQISPRVVKRARLEALVLVPLFVGIVVALRQPRQPARHCRRRTAMRRNVAGRTAGNAGAGGDGDRADDPRLGDRARHRPRARAAAVPAPGPGDRGDGRVPDPPGHGRRGADRGAACGRHRSANAGARAARSPR